MFIRTQGKIKADITSVDMYKYYVENYDYKSFRIKKSTFTKVLKEINKEIMNMIITTNYEYTLPHRLGILSIKKSKIKLKLDKEGELILSKIPVDYGKTLALWKISPEAKEAKKVIRYTNEHTDGYRFKFYWNKFPAIMKNKSIYRFRASRNNNRSINVQIESNKNLDYFEFINYIKPQ